MMKHIDPKTPISDLTIEDLTDYLSNFLNKKEKEEKYVYGMKALAKILKCSERKAYQIRDTGILDDAIMRIMRGEKKTIVIDVEKVKQLYFNVEGY